MKLKTFKLNSRSVTLVLGGFLVGAIVFSLLWQIKIHQDNIDLSYKDLTLRSFQEQITALRNDYAALQNRQTTPSPSAIPFDFDPNLNKTLSAANTYKLDCYDLPKEPSASWMPQLKQQISSDYQVQQICLNSSLNQSVISVVDVKHPSPLGLPVSLGVYDIRINTLTLIPNSCGTVVGWTKTDNIYFKCDDGGELNFDEKTYKYSVLDKSLSYVKDCEIDTADKTTSCASPGD